MFEDQGRKRVSPGSGPRTLRGGYDGADAKNKAEGGGERSFHESGYRSEVRLQCKNEMRLVLSAVPSCPS